ncbi:hypothetical protein PENTCL1PPCAC_26070, partial [Pristionchus entomophagus]
SMDDKIQSILLRTFSSLKSLNENNISEFAYVEETMRTEREIALRHDEKMMNGSDPLRPFLYAINESIERTIGTFLERAKGGVTTPSEAKPVTQATAVTPAVRRSVVFAPASGNSLTGPRGANVMVARQPQATAASQGRQAAATPAARQAKPRNIPRTLSVPTRTQRIIVPPRRFLEEGSVVRPTLQQQLAVMQQEEAQDTMVDLNN